VSLRDSDEQYHAPPSPVPERWQENLFVILWNTVTQDGFMMHVQRVPAQGVQEARIVGAIGGHIASATLTGPYELEAAVDGVEIGIIDPFRHLTVRTSFTGSPGPGPLGFIAAHPRGDVPVLVDADLRSECAAVDFAEGLAQITAALRSDAAGPQMGDQAHYEQGGTWSGRIRIGNREVDGSGLFVRDHSWGIRHEHSNFSAFWTATCLDEGRVFCNAIGIPHGDGFAGIGAISDGDGVRFTTDVAARYSPAPGLRTYDRAEVRYGAGVDRTLTAVTQTHWPMYLPYSGLDRYDNNAMSVATMDVSTATGRDRLHGFGVMEWATTLPAEQTAVLDDAATRAG
jgi:hypothetical protein